MNVVGSEVQEILPGVFRWECFSPEHKVELTSHAVLVDGKLYIFDPIELISNAKQRLLAGHEVEAIVLTNENHERSAVAWRKDVGAAIWCAEGAVVSLADVQRWPHWQTQWGPWKIALLEGGAGGEIALRWQDRSLVVLGDAVFNLPKYGFGLLPEKYCQDQGKLKKALHHLTEEPFEIALLAHGAPLLNGPSKRIRELTGN
jgi:hypothetical protein